MTLASGTRLGPYEVAAQIGEGGMGEVYQATDTTLNRQVAIKVLPESLAADTERIARFEREAKTLASLNHTNIAQIYGFEKSSGVHALVMELVEGPTLADRIAQGAIPVDEALPIARQIAEALEAAHEQGIIHRDLKPANIKVRSDGVVKVLDFGLAKALAPVGASPNSSQSPTVTMRPMTRAGVILGTAAYMSPEQAGGKAVGRGADIWAFGCVLFEMLTGRRAFEGDNVSATLARVLEREPDLGLLPSATPTALERLLRRCLTKNLKRRLRDIGDAQTDLEEAASGDNTPSMALNTPPVPHRGKRVSTAWVGAAVVAAILGGLLAWNAKPSIELPLRKSERLVNGLRMSFATSPQLSPDGRQILYTTTDGMWTWALDELAPREVRDENGVSIVLQAGNPAGMLSVTPGGVAFWSPDGQSIAFDRGGRLLRVSAAGGPVTVICELPRAMIGGAWSEDGTIAFAEWRGDLFEVPASGGTPEFLLRHDPETEVDFHDLSFLPDGRGLLYRVHALDGVGHLEALTEGTRRIVHPEGDGPRYSPSGHLLFDNHSDVVDTEVGEGVGDSRIWAAPFSLSTLTVTGDPFVVASGSFPTVSAGGTLSYVSRIPRATARQLVWVDRTGALLGSVGEPQEQLSWPSIAPDGDRIAAYGIENGDPGVWVYDAARGVPTRLTSWDGSWNGGLEWSFDGSDVIFARVVGGQFFNSLLSVPANGAGEPRVIVSGGGRSMPHEPNVSRDGRYFVYAQGEQDASQALWMLTLEEGATPVQSEEPAPFLASGSQNREISLSPDGRYAAYMSAESGLPEVYLTEFPSGDGRVKVSIDGGSDPRWNSDGSELFYVAGDRLMAAAVATVPSLSVGAREELFRLDDTIVSGQYDVAPDADGTRFIMVQRVGDGDGTAAIAVVQNWLAEFTPTN